VKPGEPGAKPSGGDPHHAWAEVSDGVSTLGKQVRALVEDPQFREGVDRVKGGLGEAVSATLGGLGLGQSFGRGFGRRKTQDSGAGADVVSIDDEIRQQRQRRPTDGPG
jgi:hypothetical protein